MTEMSDQATDRERAMVLVKALPQPSEKYTETVCVAGLTLKGEWRRLYPVRFRQLRDRFSRWHWIEYNWKKPRDDRRPESRNIDGESIELQKKMPQKERADFLAPHIRTSVDEAYAQGASLTLIRPINAKFSWERKTADEVSEERRAYAHAARQRSFFDEDNELKALEPCPYRFFFTYTTEDGRSHRNFCHDWETSAAFHRISRRDGSEDALEHLNRMYNEYYPAAGIAFAMGTHSQRPTQWLLIGVLRLDVAKQGGLGLWS